MCFLGCGVGMGCSHDVRKYSFAHWVIDIWNSLSSDIVNACSIPVFKHKLESVDFTPFVCVEFVLIFSFVRHASVSFSTCVSRLLFKSMDLDLFLGVCGGCVVQNVFIHLPPRSCDSFHSDVLPIRPVSSILFLPCSVNGLPDV